MEHVHRLGYVPDFTGSPARATCYDCGRTSERRKYERKAKYATRQAAFVNQHVPFIVERDLRPMAAELEPIA